MKFRSPVGCRTCRRCKEIKHTDMGVAALGYWNCHSCISTIANKGNVLRAMTIAEYRDKHAKGKKTAWWLNSQIDMLNRDWNRHLTKQPCLICGYSVHVDMCHIKAVCSFPDTARLSEVNHESNIIPLCRNHHWEFDHGLMDKEDLDKLPQWHEHSQEDVKNQDEGFHFHDS